MVRFIALQSAKVKDPKIPKSQGDTLDDTLDVTMDVTMDVTKESNIELAPVTLIEENPYITTIKMAERLSVNRRTIQRALEGLRSKNVIERRGGRRYGYWKIY